MNAPNGILSGKPMYTPGIDTVPALRQHMIASRRACARSVASPTSAFALS